jgi:type II secretion system protein J
MPMSNRTTTLRGRRGFTLVELLLAAAIAGFVLITVTTSLSQIGRARDTARVRLQAYLRADHALEGLRRDAASIMRDSDLFHSRVLLIDDKEAFNIDGQRVELDRDELLIFCNRLRPLAEVEYNGEGIEYETQYRIADDQLGPALWQRRDAVPDDVPAGGGVATPVSEGVIGLRIEAYDGETWFDEWDSDIDGLPWALRFTVTAVGTDQTELSYERPGTVVSLRTQVAIDRIIPPYVEPEEEEEDELETPDEDALDPETVGGIALPAEMGGRGGRDGRGGRGSRGGRGGGERPSPDGGRGGTGSGGRLNPVNGGSRGGQSPGAGPGGRGT